LAFALTLVLSGILNAQEVAQKVTSFPSPLGAYHLSGPYQHANLTIYLIHGPDDLHGKSPLTLQEALQQNKIIVHETQAVNELTIKNRSPVEDIFIQSGDIVKGGQQDRAIASDLILPPKSGKVPVAVWCVEAGRWSRRGQEQVTRFASSTAVLATRELQLAARYGGASFQGFQGGLGGFQGFQGGLGGGFQGFQGGLGGGFQGFQGSIQRGTGFQGFQGGLGGGFQGAVWNQVAVTQGKLARSIGRPVIGALSNSSLQLTLEHPDVTRAVAGITRPLAKLLKNKTDVVGFAFAVNGKVSSAEVYASPALFRKLWPRLLRATAVEAVAEQRSGHGRTGVGHAMVKGFLVEASRRPVFVAGKTRRTQLVERESDHTLLFETRDLAHQKLVVHRSYLAK
jgi:hypothetical protein